MLIGYWCRAAWQALSATLFPLLCDEDNKVAKAYGAWGTKKSFGKTREGIIRSSFLIDEKGRIVEAWYKVKPDDTVPKALEAAG